MLLLSSHFRKGEASCKVEDLDDLWYLSTIIDPGDLIKAKTFRKVKIGGENDRKVRIEKKVVWLEIKVEKVEFASNTSTLRISGTVEQGTDDVPSGSHHSISVGEQTILTIRKPAWLSYHKERLKQATEPKQASILICVFDRDIAFLAILKKSSYEIISVLRGDGKKKADVKIQSTEFFPVIIKALQQSAEQYKVEKIIVASPAFWNEELLKHLKDKEFKKKIVLASCSSADESGLQEVLKRPEVADVLKADRISKETLLVEKVFAEIGKDGKVAYGFKEISNAVSLGAVDTLLVTDQTIQKMRQNKTYNKLEKMMHQVEAAKGKVHLISQDHEAGKRLQGLGGVASLLRFMLR